MRILFNSTLILLGLSIALLLAEVGVRLSMVGHAYFERSLEENLARAEQTKIEEVQSEAKLAALVRPNSNRDIVYELKPGLSGQFLGVPLRTNKIGIRGPEIEITKPEAMFRIVGIGDSVMFGWGVKEEDTYLSVIERTLNTRRPTQVLNFGVPGYNTTMEVATLESKALQFKPDLIILHVVNNDWGVPHFMAQPESPFILTRSYLLRLMQQRLYASQKKSPSGLRELGVGMEQGDLEKVMATYRYMVGQGGYRNAFKRLASITAPLQIPVIVVMGSASEPMPKITAKLCKKYGFTLITVKPYVDKYFSKFGHAVTPEQRRKKLQLASGDPHPNAIGHGLYAEALLEGINEIFP